MLDFWAQTSIIMGRQERFDGLRAPPWPFLAAVLVQKQPSLPLDLNLADFNFTYFNLANIVTIE